MDTLEHIFSLLFVLALIFGFDLFTFFIPEKHLKKVGMSIIGLLLTFWLVTAIIFKNVLLVDEDGKSLKYATVYVVESGEQHKKRTNSRGRIRVNRFKLDSITLDGLRYPRQTWESSKIKGKLVAKKNIIGKGVDSALNKILKN